MKMKNRIRRIITAVLALTMLLSLAACGGNSDSPDSSGTPGNSNAASYDASNPLTLTYYNTDGIGDNGWSDPVAAAMTEATGIKLEISTPVSNSTEDITLMIAQGEYPDLIYAKGDASKLVEAGALLDMTDLIKEYGPNIQKMYGDELNKLQYSLDDPAIYQLSSYGVGGRAMTTSGTAQIQWAVLKENNYQLPTTLDEFEAMIKSYLADHPTTEDGLEMIGLTITAADWRWMIDLGNPGGYIAGYPDNGEWIIDENYNAIFKYRDDNVRAYFKWLGRMYDEGILDPTFATQTWEDYIAKISTGRVVALTDQKWEYNDAQAVLVSDGKVDQTYAALPLTLNKDITCAMLCYQGLTTGWGVGITTSCKDPVAAIKFLDYMCSDEAQILNHWGIEEVNYFYDDNGIRYRTEEEIARASSDQNYTKDTGIGYYVNGFPCYGDGETDATGNTYNPSDEASVKATYNDAEKEAVAAMGINLLIDIFPGPENFETPPYSATSTYAMNQEYNEIFTELEEIAWPGLIRAVSSGQGNFDANYDAMIADLEKAKMSRAEELMTEKVKESMEIANRPINMG